MLRTKSLISKLNDIPREWVYEHYLNLQEKLTGQDVKIHSVFKTEKTPSMFIYFKGKETRFIFNKDRVITSLVKLIIITITFF